jgi:hypothetical protein
MEQSEIVRAAIRVFIRKVLSEVVALMQPTQRSDTVSHRFVGMEEGIAPPVRTPMPPVRKLDLLLHRDFILEVVRIEWIHSSLRCFRLRIHEINQRLFGAIAESRQY